MTGASKPPAVADEKVFKEGQVTMDALIAALTPQPAASAPPPAPAKPAGRPAAVKPAPPKP